MPKFDDYVIRHGEYWVQDLIERLERYRGTMANPVVPVPLEARWIAVMNQNAGEPKFMAA
jgi:hypothetical protein